MIGCYFFFSSRRRHTRWPRDWSSDVCSSDLEGEEEAGSPTFRPFIETFRERLSAALIIVADSANWAVGVPSLTTSLRGLVDVVVEVRALDHAVHSGIFGGPVLDALTQRSEEHTSELQS